VLEEALDPENPLLERVRFVSIVASNLDEFFMIRVAGLKQQLAAGITAPPADGLAPAEQLAQVRREASRWARAPPVPAATSSCRSLAAAAIHVLDYPQLSPKQVEVAGKYFDEIVFPVLTPLAVDPGRRSRSSRTSA